MDTNKIANLLFPNIKITTDDIEKKYPKRNLEKNQVVSRYAPSPTGYMHIGNFFQMFISYNLVKNTNGKFFIRIEDTDSKREKKDATAVIYEILSKFGILQNVNEYQTLDGVDVGNYGPYVQSQRVEIYKAYAKKLVAEGKAFPCFCKKTEGKDDVLKLREEKFAEGEVKEYDPCRNLTDEEIENNIKEGKTFAIRLKTKNDGSQKIKFFDLIKGEIEAPANAKDVILLKDDGIPPYAFAHAIDDTLMGTTIVVRGEEYISSAPSHIEIFDALGFKPITYCHNPLICKIDQTTGNRRKISKRYDPEADMRYYFEKGYPTDSVLEYLLNLINSKFEGWRQQNPTLPWTDFTFGIKDITTVAPIFDLVKLDNISKNIISRIPAKELLNNIILWADEYDNNFSNVLKSNLDYAEKILKIDRENDRPRKDIANFSEVKNLFSYMFDETFDKISSLVFDEKYNHEDIKALLSNYSKIYSKDDTKEDWFEKLKSCASNCGYASTKEYKANPTAYKGSIADASNIVRIAITGRAQTPDLFEIMKLLGANEIKSRFDFVINNL